MVQNVSTSRYRKEQIMIKQLESSRVSTYFIFEFVLKPYLSYSPICSNHNLKEISIFLINNETGLTNRTCIRTKHITK